MRRVGGKEREHPKDENGHPQKPPAPPPQAQPQPSENHQRQSPLRHGRYQHGSPGPARHHARDSYNHLDSPAHGRQGDLFQAQRHEKEGQHPPRHDPQRRQRHRHQVGGQSEKSEAVELVNGEGCGGEAGHQRGQRHPAHVERRDAPPVSPLVGLGPPSWKAVPKPLIHRHQGHHGGERHLETGPQQTFGADKENYGRGPGHHAQGDGGAVSEHGHQHQPGHDEGALGGDGGPGNEKIGKRPHQGRQRRPFLDGIMKR